MNFIECMSQQFNKHKSGDDGLLLVRRGEERSAWFGSRGFLLKRGVDKHHLLFFYYTIYNVAAI